MTDQPAAKQTLELEAYLDVAARWILRLALESWYETGWESHFPDFGESDFERIYKTATEMLPADVEGPEMEKAYTFFEARAAEWAEREGLV